MLYTILFKLNNNKIDDYDICQLKTMNLVDLVTHVRNHVDK